MATVHVSIVQFGTRGKVGTHDAAASPMRSEVITSSGTSAPGNLIARNGDIARVFCATAVYATVAATPVAAAANSVYVPAGIPVEIAMQAGDKVAVIDVA